VSSTIVITLTTEEARWLATAITVLQRILRGLPTHPEYSAEGLSVLRRVAEHLPSGHMSRGMAYRWISRSASSRSMQYRRAAECTAWTLTLASYTVTAVRGGPNPYR
jgi:hypothetical protein